MSNSDPHARLALQSSFGLDGFQRDLFDEADEPDGVALAAAEAQATFEDETLFPVDDLRRSQPSERDRHPSARLLRTAICSELTRRDAEEYPRLTETGEPTRVEVLVRLSAAGHALLIASAIEREIRRCERAARPYGSSGAGVTKEFLRELSETPHPSGIKNDGLRLVGATVSPDNAVTIVMTEPPQPYTSLARWPRFVAAFATSAIADDRFDVVDSGEWSREVRLPALRLKAIAGGVPRGAVEVRLTAPGLSVQTLI